MELQGRNLVLRMRGDDVVLLHTELGQLGLAIDRAEVAARHFGTTTREAVIVGVRKAHSNLRGSDTQLPWALSAKPAMFSGLSMGDEFLYRQPTARRQTSVSVLPASGNFWLEA